MPNPKQRKEFLVPKPRADKAKEKLSKKVVAVKLTEEVDDVVRSLPSMTACLRRVITEPAQRELMKGDSPQPNHAIDETEGIDYDKP